MWNSNTSMKPFITIYCYKSSYNCSSGSVNSEMTSCQPIKNCLRQLDWKVLISFEQQPSSLLD